MNDKELLQLRFKDLHLSFEGGALEGCFCSLNDELAGRNILARPHAWISEEWFSPDNTPGIAFPFYLAHPRLAKLERRMMLDVEGGTKRDCMKILRHEAGHVIQHAYKLHRRRKWRELFGKSSTPYPDFYRPNPASKHYVQHLRRWYAQSHPDEDFAETFAVWLTPRSDWRKRYADWPVALAKLEYVDELMTEISGVKPQLTSRIEVDPVNRLTMTLGEHYQRKLDHYAVHQPAKFDGDLQRIFAAKARDRSAPPASTFIRRNRAEIRRAVSRRTGAYQITLDAAIDDMIDRCRALKLRAVGSERSLRTRITALLADKSVHSLYSSSRKQWIAV
jgi:hypothetical protein